MFISGDRPSLSPARAVYVPVKSWQEDLCSCPFLAPRGRRFSHAGWRSRAVTLPGPLRGSPPSRRMPVDAVPAGPAPRRSGRRLGRPGRQRPRWRRRAQATPGASRPAVGPAHRLFKRIRPPTEAGRAVQFEDVVVALNAPERGGWRGRVSTRHSPRRGSEGLSTGAGGPVHRRRARRDGAGPSSVPSGASTVRRPKAARDAGWVPSDGGVRRSQTASGGRTVSARKASACSAPT